MIKRPRRLRDSDRLRRLARETRISKDSLIYPIFVTQAQREEIPSMPGQYRESLESLPGRAEALLNAGVSAALLFGIPINKDEAGSGAYSPDGIVQKAVELLKREFPELYAICDTCMCEYTSHGHCGHINEDGYVDNDKSLELIAQTALSQAQAGADMVAPSDMMDGRVAAIRGILDSAGFERVSIMSYAAKYASAFYGPFREAAGSAPAFGDRKQYQMDFHNSREALKEIALDIEEGCDIAIVKPALSYLDIIAKAKSQTNIPIAAYSVSGEFSMIKAASAAGYIDEDAIVAESAVSIFRAGADMLITYYAEEIAAFVASGRIG
ncbi:MAG: porphobilinogen synthase [Eubacteriaceae bacterium]|jgi:porphobilinogen synthase|nr:porphobilinogen synthase [Eubacteriaceae bacterium]